MYKRKKLLEPNILKIDIEGGELLVLRGGKKLINNSKPIMIIEYSDSTSIDAGYERDQIIKELENFSYSIYGLSADYNDLNLYRKKDFEKNNIANIIALPRNNNLSLP